MCAALAARKDSAEELAFAASLINRVVNGFGGMRIGLHVCRGNWSRDETTLLSGGYQSLKEHLDRLAVTQLVLEYATDRAGDVIAFPENELGLGVVNPRTDAIESAASIRSAVEQALRVYPASRVFLNPDCGFGTFSNRPMNSEGRRRRQDLRDGGGGARPSIRRAGVIQDVWLGVRTIVATGSSARRDVRTREITPIHHS